MTNNNIYKNENVRIDNIGSKRTFDVILIMWKLVWRPYHLIYIYIVNVCACKHTTSFARAFNNNNNNNSIRFGPFDYCWKTKQKSVFFIPRQGAPTSSSSSSSSRERVVTTAHKVFFSSCFFLITNVFVRGGVRYARVHATCTVYMLYYAYGICRLSDRQIFIIIIMYVLLFLNLPHESNIEQIK